MHTQPLFQQRSLAEPVFRPATLRMQNTVKVEEQKRQVEATMGVATRPSVTPLGWRDCCPHWGGGWLRHTTDRQLSIASQLHYIRDMKTASLPSVRVEPHVRAEVEAVLAEGESLSEFVEAAVRAGVERRRNQQEFIARGLRSREAARQSGEYVDAEVVLNGLQRTLDDARAAMAAKQK